MPGDDAARPHVSVPPPLLFAGGWLIAWLLSWVRAFEIDGAGASTIQTVLGLILMGAGFALMLWAILTFVRARTPVIPTQPARIVVADGPFRFTRNPIYLGFTSIYLGLAAVLNQAWPLVMLPIVLIALTVLVIEREEAHLLARFGGEYERYRSRVRRWI